MSRSLLSLLTPTRTLVLGVGALLAAGGCHKKADAPWKLPIDAKQLPPTTSLLEAEVIDGTRETDPHVKQIFTSAELGSEICRAHASDPAHELEVMSSLGSGSAKRFFKPAPLADVQSLMQCGELLTTNLDGAFQTAIDFTDDTNAKQEVGIIPFKATEIPTQYGFTKHAFSGLDGFCRTTDMSKPNTPTTDCNAGSDAALKQGSSWFFGTRSALESVAHTVTAPKGDLSTQVAALNDAANELEGLSSMRISAQLTTAKPFLTAPCTWGGYQTAGSLNDFVQGCFPTSDEKVIQDMDAKLRAAAFEIEPNVLKSGGVHGNVVLVARDDDAAKVVEKDAQDLAADWKSQLENNEAKMVKQAKTNPVSLRQKSWAIIVDNFTRAMEKIKVSRSGRTVKLAFSESLDDADKRDLADANKETLDKRVAVADLLDAIAQKKPLPPDALGKIVGAPWAAYFVQEATFDPKSLPADCAPVAGAKKPAPGQAKGKKGGPSTAAAPVVADPRCAAPVEPPESEYGDHPAKSAASATK
jgi:hypothetical protein